MRDHALTAFVVGLLLAATAEHCRAEEAEPSLAITAIEPTHAAFGAKIKLVGRGFRGTKKVLFVVGYVKSKEARFQVISDTELQVELPEYLQAEVKAAIVVQSAAGATVTMPPETMTVDNPTTGGGKQFTLVKSQGAIERGGKYVTFIESDGIVASGGPVVLMAKDGRLDKVVYDVPSSGVVFHENGALISTDVKRHATLIAVPRVFVSPVESLFTYDTVDPDSSDPNVSEARLPPEITKIVPNQGFGGDIVEIYGKGFTGTRSVIFNQSGERHEAGFRVKSDTVLRVEVPWLRYNGPHVSIWTTIVIVESPHGLAFTLERGTKLHTAPNAPGGGGGGSVAWIGKGGSYVGGGGGLVTLIDAGGIFLSGGGGSCTYFVKAGGTILEAGGGDTVVYCEPQARLGDKLRNDGGGVIEVPHIRPGLVDAYFNSTRSGNVPGRPR